MKTKMPKVRGLGLALIRSVMALSVTLKTSQKVGTIERKFCL